MINKLTRFGCGNEFYKSDVGNWVNYDEVKELLANQEKKTKILLDALEEIENIEHINHSFNGGVYVYYCIEVAQKALEEYRKE